MCFARSPRDCSPEIDLDLFDSCMLGHAIFTVGNKALPLPYFWSLRLGSSCARDDFVDIVWANFWAD